MSETPRPEASDAPDIVELQARSKIVADYIDEKLGGVRFDYAGHDSFTVASHLDALTDAIAALRAELAAVKRERDAMTLEKDQFRREAAFHFAKSCEYAEAREAAEAEVARLVAGLEPFAEAALNVKETTPGRFVHVTPNGTHNDLSFISLPPPPFLRARSLTATKGG